MTKRNLLFILILLLIGCQSKRQKSKIEFNKGFQCFNEKQYPLSINYLQNAINIDTSFSQAKFLLSKCYKEQKNYDGAIQSLQSIKNSEINDDSIFLLYANIYNLKGDNDKSIEYADKTLAKNRNNLAAYKIKIKSLYNKAAHSINGNEIYNEALDNIIIAEKISPNDFECLMFRGIIRYGMEDFVGSINDLKSVIENEKKDSLLISNSYRFIGMCLHQTMNNKEALLYLDTSIVYNSKRGLNYMNRGEIKKKLNMSDGACEDFRKALELGEHSAVEYIQKNCKGN